LVNIVKQGGHDNWLKDVLQEPPCIFFDIERRNKRSKERKNMKHIRTLLLLLLLATSSLMQAQGPPDPPGLGHGTGGDQPPGGNAPVGSGMLILLTLVVGYGAAKTASIYKKRTNQDPNIYQSYF